MFHAVSLWILNLQVEFNQILKKGLHMQASDNAKTAAQSFPFLAILALIFITLKLTGHITWSWFWVLAPLWLPAAIGLTLLLAGLALLIVAALMNRRC